MADHQILASSIKFRDIAIASVDELAAHYHLSMTKPGTTEAQLEETLRKGIPLAKKELQRMVRKGYLSLPELKRAAKLASMTPTSEPPVQEPENETEEAEKDRMDHDAGSIVDSDSASSDEDESSEEAMANEGKRPRETPYSPNPSHKKRKPATFQADAVDPASLDALLSQIASTEEPSTKGSSDPVQQRSDPVKPSSTTRNTETLRDLSTTQQQQQQPIMAVHQQTLTVQTWSAQTMSFQTPSVSPSPLLLTPSPMPLIPEDESLFTTEDPFIEAEDMSMLHSYNATLHHHRRQRQAYLLGDRDRLVPFSPSARVSWFIDPTSNLSQQHTSPSQESSSPFSPSFPLALLPGQYQAQVPLFY